MSATAVGTSAGSSQPLIRYGPVGADRLGHDLAAFDRCDEGEEVLGLIDVLALGGDVERRRHPDRQAVLGGVRARLAKKPTSLSLSG